MKIKITMDLDDDFADPDDKTGMTEEGFDGINDALSDFGGDIVVKKMEGKDA